MLTKKYWRKKFRALRNRTLGRMLDTKWGRKVYIESINPRVLEMTVDCGDHVMTFAPTEYIGKKIYRKGHFERDHVTRLLNVLKEQGLYKAGGTLLELGGNIGTQTVYFALSKAYNKIISVEPDPRNFALLKRNIAQNSLQDQVTLVNFAAGETAGFIDFYQNQDNHGKSSAYRQSDKDLKLQVAVKPVKEIIESTGSNINDIALIWMDIEGYEPVACRSMQDLMTAKVPLYMEFSPMFYGAEKAKEFKTFLNGFYNKALLFYEDHLVPIDVKELPLDEEQFDVLFF